MNACFTRSRVRSQIACVIVYCVLCALGIGLSAVRVFAASAPARGIAILASDIGKDYKVEALADFVQQGNFSPVIVDWAWITFHWERTDFAQVNRFVNILSERDVEVAAMYRPRFLGQATVPIQVTREGKPATSHGQYICYSSDEARRWGMAWGEDILQRCPGFKEIIIYNPLNLCECPKCLEGQKADAYAHYTRVWEFLAQARAAWRARKPGVKLGVVFVTDPEFWRRGADIVDAARPFLFIMDDTDMEKDMAAVLSVREIMKDKLKSCLAKITWGPNDKVSAHKLAAFDRLARDNSIPYFFWTFDTLFASELYDLRAACSALGLNHAALQGPLSRMRAASASAVSDSRSAAGAQPGSGFYTDDQLRATRPDVLFECILRPQRGYHTYAALNGLTRKAQISDAAAREAIVAKAIGHLKGRTPRTFQLRLQCCMLLGDIAGERAIPALANTLLQDPAQGVRMAAAGVLGKFDNPQARSALERAAKREREPHAREAIRKALRGEFKPGAAPAGTRPTSTASLRREPETYLRHASQLPPSPVKVKVERLPWPFPGGFRQQHIFNNYQQPTDIYIHGALDFILPAGTQVRAVESGYVAAIYTNYPQWKTHHGFIVTPKKGGNEGWCYVHVDPDSYTFRVGDYVRQGQVLGTLVKFSLGDRPGVDHLHLHYVRFERTADGKVEVESLLDPLYFFDYEDTLAPLILTPFHFVKDGSLDEFPIDDNGDITVSGKVDVIVAIADGAFDHGCNWGVPVVTFTITGAVPYALQKLVLDHRGELGKKHQTRPLYLSHEDKKRFLENPDGFPRYQLLRITKTDGDGLIEAADALHTWDTTARDQDGKRIWPDGEYTMTVYAWDLAGNRSAAESVVRVKND